VDDAVPELDQMFEQRSLAGLEFGFFVVRRRNHELGVRYRLRRDAGGSRHRFGLRGFT